MPSMRIAMCVCAIACTSALTKLTAKESTQSTEKAILSDLYLRKAAPKYPQPSGNELTCSTHHHRNDPQPPNSANGAYVPSNVRRVESYLIGEGLWKRYDGNHGKPWSHAKIDANWKAKGLIEMARDGKTPNDGMKYRAMNNHYKNLLKNAINSIKHECSNVGNCRHDNYISIPVGEANATVFSPGLNQMWIILDPGRHHVFCHINVGAQADDSTTGYYIGGADATNFNTVMTLDITSFSDRDNPLMFKLAVNTGTGLASLTMDTKHHNSGGCKYIHVVWQCRFGGISGWKDRWSILMWGHKHYHKEFSLFLDKGTQIYDICHCYHQGSGNLINCVTSDDGSGMWHEALGILVQSVHLLILSNAGLWHIIPRVYVGHWKSCWNHYMGL